MWISFYRITSFCCIVLSMSDAHSTAAKLRWAHIPLDKRSKRMSVIAKERWSGVSAKKRREYAINKLVKGRKRKAKNKK